MSRAPLLIIVAASGLLAGCPGPKGPTPPPAYVPKERISEEPAPLVAEASATAEAQPQAQGKATGH
jgi:hypothetical protein